MSIVVGTLIYIYVSRRKRYQLRLKEKESELIFAHLSGESHLTDFTLSGLEGKLSENFARVHRGCILNTEKVKEFMRGFNGAFVIVMNDREGTKITSSRSYAEE